MAGLELENPFSHLKLSSWDPLRKVVGRSQCPSCGRSRKFYCYSCYHLIGLDASDVPRIRLPIKIDIIKHRLEVEGKSTSSHAKILVPDDVSIHIYPSVPDYQDTSRLLLLYPTAVPAKQMGTTPCKCKLKCFEIVDEAQRQKLFDGFWETTDFNLQNAYISGCVKVISVKRRYTDTPDDSRRNYSRVFYVQNGSVSSRICKQAFLKIHDISNGRLNRVLKAVEKSGGSPHQDLRGKHEPVNKTPTDKIEHVKEHIASFPATSSHYSRADNPNRKYLSSQLSLSKMYVLYKEMCASKSQEPVSEWVYRRVFNEEFNLSFGSPRTDTCKTCDEFKVKADAETDSDSHQQIMFDWELHKVRAESAYQSLREDTALSKSSTDIEMLTFDLQQVLSTPLLTTNVVFYKRQLSTYNLGIHDCKTDQGFMHLWHEGVASRGSGEIGSCLLYHLREKATTATKLILYSDSCGGQNRNINLLCLWLYIVANPDLPITQIDQKFMVSGHSFLPNDRDFGSIESEKKRRSQVFSTGEWCQLVRECRRSNPFHVTEMKQTDFVNIKDLPSYVVNRKVNKRKQKVDWLSIRWIRVVKDKPFAFQYRYSLNSLEAWNEVDISPKRRGRPTDIGRATIPPLHDGPLRLKKEKISDLMFLLAYIPPHYHDFYKQFQAPSSSSSSDAETGDESSSSDSDGEADSDSDSDVEDMDSD